MVAIPIIANYTTPDIGYYTVLILLVINGAITGIGICSIFSYAAML